MSESLSHVDLFAGVGGFALGFEAAGFNTRLLVDSDRSAVTTFKRNRPQIPYWPKDISKIDGRDILDLARLGAGQLDVLTAGPPCQGLSKIGPRQLDDERNALLKRTGEMVGQLLPKLVLIENVPALFWDGHNDLFVELAS